MLYFQPNLPQKSMIKFVWKLTTSTDVKNIFVVYSLHILIILATGFLCSPFILLPIESHVSINQLTNFLNQ